MKLCGDFDPTIWFHRVSFVHNGCNVDQLKYPATQRQTYPCRQSRSIFRQRTDRGTGCPQFGPHWELSRIWAPNWFQILKTSPIWLSNCWPTQSTEVLTSTMTRTHWAPTYNKWRPWRSKWIWGRRPWRGQRREGRCWSFLSPYISPFVFAPRLPLNSISCLCPCLFQSQCPCPYPFPCPFQIHLF